MEDKGKNINKAGKPQSSTVLWERRGDAPNGTEQFMSALVPFGDFFSLLNQLNEFYRGKIYFRVTAAVRMGG